MTKIKFDIGHGIVNTFAYVIRNTDGTYSVFFEDFESFDILAKFDAARRVFYGSDLW